MIKWRCRFHSGSPSEHADLLFLHWYRKGDGAMDEGHVRCCPGADRACEKVQLCREAAATPSPWESFLASAILTAHGFLLASFTAFVGEDPTCIFISPFFLPHFHLSVCMGYSRILTFNLNVLSSYRITFNFRWVHLLITLKLHRFVRFTGEFFLRA